MSNVSTCTVHVSKIPYEAVAKDIVEYFESVIGSGTVVACEIKTERNSSRSKGFGFVQFETEDAVKKAFHLSRQGVLFFRNSLLRVNSANREVKQRPHHNQTEITGGILHMGCLVNRHTMQALWSSKKDVKVNIDYGSRKLWIILNANGRTYKMEWHFRDIYNIDTYKLKRSQTKSLLVKAWIVPQVYQELACLKSLSFLLDVYNFYREDVEPSWCRTTDFTDNKSVGQSFVYCVDLPQVNQVKIDDLFKKLADYRIAHYPGDKELMLENGGTYSSCQTAVPILCSRYIDQLPFQQIFKVNYLVQHGYLSGPSVGFEFLQLIHPSNTPIECTNFLLEKLSRKSETCYDPVIWFKNQIKELKKSRRRPGTVRVKPDDGQMLVHRLLVTPCRVYCLGPEIDVSNRVTRHFMENIDNFLRVSFVEEDHDIIGSNALLVQSKSSSSTEHSDVFKRILLILQEGVTIGGKKFEFLAFSSSQLRERSVWMFASNDRITADGIRSWMGNFLSIRNVAKCAARMGQSFSSSAKSLDVHPSEVQRIPDIERQNGGTKYCFSDGIGKISLRFATEVAKKCGYKRLYNRVPSAFQIRYGGYKGVVAVDPSCSYKLALRPSMNKFPSNYTGLDILNWTHFIPCYLNRQAISLLSTLGVPDSVFEELQRRVISHLENMLQSGEVALEVLQMFCGGDNHMVMMEMLSAGYHPSEEPFLKSMLCAFRASQLMDLRKRTRIFVSKGRVLMGCLDETSTLAYGQVFIQVSSAPGRPHRFFNDGLRLNSNERMKDGSYMVVGKVIVTKNPCVHPGDVRILNAVNVPALRHMVDCIVFPQQGPRPHPNECSGSDLDGDLYLVSWDEVLIPPEVDPPMDYIAPAQVQLDHPVTIQEIEEYFCNYIINDSLGIISNAHTVFADSEPRKARDPKCLELAKLCSIAVDFPKTGVPAVLPFNLRPKAFPDFMEKTDKERYISERILGKLYRSVKDIDDKLPKFSYSKEDVKMCYDRKLEVPGFDHYLEEALTLKNWYDEKLIGLMNQYDIKCEAEILTGNILSLSKFYKRRTGEVKERIQKAVSSLKKEARSWFEENSDEQIDNYNTQHNAYEEYAKASAWYHVTYHPDYVAEALDEAAPESPLLSFPWVVYDKLLKIKKGLHLT